MLDDDLLSHGETPHYHRRYVVSLLSSGWDQVVPTCYGRQAIRYEFGGLRTCSMSASIDSNRAVDCKVIAGILIVTFSFYLVSIAFAYWMLAYRTSPVADKYFFLQLNRKPSNSRFCYMVKPHEQLVLVSSTHRCASTPNLSTS